MIKAKDYPAIKMKLWNSSNGTCALCGYPISFEQATIDHKIASTNGGGDDLENLQLAHNRCNDRKGNRDITEFPPPSHYEGREYVMTIRLSPSLKARMQKYADANGLTLTALARHIILNLPDDEGEEGMEAELTALIERLVAKRNRAREKKPK